MVSSMKVIFETEDARFVIPCGKEPYIEVRCYECGGHGYTPTQNDLLNCKTCNGNGSIFYNDNGDANESSYRVTIV